MLQVDPSRRLKIPDIRKHRWMLGENVNLGISPQQYANNLGAANLYSNSASLQPISTDPANSLLLYNEHVLRLMASAGINREKTVEAVQKEAFDHYVCTDIAISFFTF